MKRLYPDIYVKSISAITASMLTKMGMEAVVLDIDNTLVPHNDPNPTREVMDFLEDMRKNNIKICVVSNNSYDRAKKFCDRIGVTDFVARAFKPRAYGYLKAAELLGVDAAKTVAIGDQLFTDVLGGRRAGCYTVLVDPIKEGNEGMFIAVKRFIEKPFVKKLKKVE